VRNIITKYGIVESDIYNFDETGFMMGIISTGIVVTSAERRSNAKLAQPGNREWTTVIQGINSQGWWLPPFIIVAGQYHLSTWYQDSPIPQDWVIATAENGWTTNEMGLEWVRHFNKHTKPRTTGEYRLLILDGHESHLSVDFELYCKDNKIITLCMPSHSSHILQPLDVGCFGPLKQAYGRQIERKMRAGITHISKEDFFPVFLVAFQESMTGKNIRGGFKGAGLVPLDPESVISKLDVKLRTPTPVEGGRRATRTLGLSNATQSDRGEFTIRIHQEPNLSAPRKLSDFDFTCCGPVCKGDAGDHASDGFAEVGKPDPSAGE
jgi:hypothetical protein